MIESRGQGRKAAQKLLPLTQSRAPSTTGHFASGIEELRTPFVNDPKISTARSAPPKANPAPLDMELHWWRWTLLVAGVATIVASFYAEENWRGRRAWQRCRTQLEAKGATVDWRAYIPPPIREGDNFFAAPNMTAWFVGRGGSDLGGRLAVGLTGPYSTNPLVELTVVGPNAQVNSAEADLVLDYQDSVLTTPCEHEEIKPSQAFIAPVIVLQNAPLIDAIRNLARSDNLKCKLDPQVQRECDGQPLVSDSWSNVTAHAALVAVLNNYNLALVPDGKTGVARIVKKDRGDREVYLPREVAQQSGALLERVVSAQTEGVQEPSATSIQRCTTIFRTLRNAKPARIIVRAAKVPETTEVEQFFPKKVLSYLSNVSRAQAQPSGSNSFRIWFSGLPCTAAADYLAWSDEFESDFDLIREALKRPFCRMNGDYQDPVTIPIPKFLTLRIVSQTLAQRAQCQLLLEQSEAAFRDLSLVHDLGHILEAKPAGKPMTLLAAMVHGALAQLYVQVVADGLRLHAWHEPQLVAIQAQLRSLNLLPFVSDAFATERVSLCHTLETLTAGESSQILYGQNTPGMSARLTDPIFIFLALAPRGWVYHNMATVAGRQQMALDSLDRSQTLILPQNANKLSQEYTLASSKRFSPRSFLADNFLPNFTRAIQQTARTQTLVNEARAACALEQYHRAKGQYPPKLDTLSPQFLESIPLDVFCGKPLAYRVTEGDKYTLYSIGWNGKDDGGVPGPRQLEKFDLEQGDWVWPLDEKLIK